MQEEFDLGRLLGRREAFSFIGARCSAAEAVTLHEIREKKAYLPRCKDWEEFCTTHLHMSRTQANRIIRLLEEFGPGYFELAQLTRISPETYRAVEPYIEENALHLGDETIELRPENAARITAMIAEIRQGTPAPDPVEAVEKRIAGMLKLLAAVAQAGSNRERLAAAVGELRGRLEEVERQLA
jgi:hypothetical protein